MFSLAVKGIANSGAVASSVPGPLACRAGLLKEEAIGLLQRFYQMENPNAPNPRAKCEREQHKRSRTQEDEET